MKIASDLFDSRINAKNVLVEVSILEYEKLVTDIVKENEFQRKRVKSSKTVYALLREDLLKQCVIPPIVLALTSDVEPLKGDVSDSVFESLILKNKANLVILDGLQRTHTILDLLSDLRLSNDEKDLAKVLSGKLRVEIYIGLNRIGILYRMLTLNTGQTPMSLRQQIEMLYLDYLKKDLNGLELIKDSENRSVVEKNQYNFKDVIEGFNAYLDRDELPIDKANILENINSLEKLSKENQKSDLFEDYLLCLKSLVAKFDELCGEREVTQEFVEDKGVPFGKTAIQIIKKPQSISGFGAAIGKLYDFKMLSSINDVPKIVSGIKIEDVELFLEEVNTSLYWLKRNSKKIGNAQRGYFAYFYRDLMNKEGDTYQDPYASSKSALRKYQAQNM